MSDILLEAIRELNSFKEELNESNSRIRVRKYKQKDGSKIQLVHMHSGFGTSEHDEPNSAKAAEEEMEKAIDDVLAKNNLTRDDVKIEYKKHPNYGNLIVDIRTPLKEELNESRNDLKLLAQAYDLAEKLSISEDDVDDFKSNWERKNDSFSLPNLITILETGIKVKELLQTKFAKDCEIKYIYLNDTYRNGPYTWDADDIGVQFDIKPLSKKDIRICIEPDRIEVFDFDEIDDTDKTFSLNQFDEAVNYGVFMGDDED